MTLSYADAVIRAKHYLFDGLRTGLALESDGQTVLFAADQIFKSTALGINMLRQYPSELFDWAEREADGFDAAKHGVAEALERGEELPAEAIVWLVKFLRQEISPPKKRTGPQDRRWKHLLICEAIRTLVAEGMKATRNDATSQASACDVVADALDELGLEPNGFDGVKDVWKQRDKPKGKLLDLR